MKKEDEEKNRIKRTLAYKNVYKRVIRLSKIGLLEEIKPDTYMPHGRIDYKVTSKGLSSIIPYVIDHPKELNETIQYMDQFKLDKDILRNALRERFYSAFRMVVEVPMRDYYEKGSHWFNLKEGNELLEAITTQTKVSPPPHDADKERTAELFIGALRALEEEEKTVTKKRKYKSSKDNAEDKEFLHEMKLSLMPSNTTKKVTKRSNANELEMARNIAEIEATIIELYENLRFLLRHHGIEIILERDRSKNRIILKRFVPYKDASVIRPQNEVKSIVESADKSIDRMKEAFPATTESIKKLEEIVSKIDEFSRDKSVEVIEGITTSKIDKKKLT